MARKCVRITENSTLVHLIPHLIYPTVKVVTLTHCAMLLVYVRMYCIDRARVPESHDVHAFHCLSDE